MILHIISALGMGGAERNLVQIACALQRDGRAQHVARIGDDDVWSGQLAAGGVGVTPLGVTNTFLAPRGVLRLARLIRELRPDVVQGWMYHGDLFAALAHRMAPGRKDRRLFWNLRASDTDEGGYGSIVALAARLSSWPDLVIANARTGLDAHLARGYRPRRAEVVPNGIDTERFRPDTYRRLEIRAEFGLLADDLLAIHVARVDPMKDHATFLAAMAAVPQWRGLVVGKGTEALALPANVKAAGLRDDVERLYAAADVVVSTSAYAEGFSNAVAEGMSAGLTAIATDIGDARVVVGNTGTVVPRRAPEPIVNALKRIAELPKTERLARGSEARRHIVENFDLAAIAQRYARLYDTA